MSLVAKFLASVFLVAVAGFASARNVHVLALSDQLGANCHERQYAEVQGVYVIGEDGEESAAADPLQWSDCDGGSIWMPLAARLIQRPDIDKVILVPVAVANARAESWQAGGDGSRRLEEALKVAKSKGIKFDYALWQQPPDDLLHQSSSYIDQVRTVMKNTSLTIPVEKWLIASTGACIDPVLQQIAAAHALKLQQVIFNRFVGPNDIGLVKPDSAPRCALNADEQEEMAQRWFDAITDADRKSKRYQKESLLYYFKKRI